MPINIKIDGGDEGNSATKVSLQIRRTLDDNYIILDHEDIDIILSPEQSKIITLCREVFDDKIYDTQSRLFKYLSKKGVIQLDTIQSGNIYGSLEAVIPTNDKVNPMDMVLLVVSKWLESEKPNYIYTEEFQDRYEEELLEPDKENSTEQGEFLHQTQKRKNTDNANVASSFNSMAYKLEEVKKKSPIDEKNAAEKRGIELENTLQTLAKYASADNIFVQFSDINKLGIYPDSKYKTPLGIYCYPLDADFINQYKEQKVPFAYDRKNLVIFQYTGDRLWIINEDNEMPKEKFEILINELLTSNKFEKYEMSNYFLRQIRKYKFSLEHSTSPEDKERNMEKINATIELIMGQSRKDTNDGHFWNITRNFSNSPKMWAYILNKFYDGVVDNGTSIIHPNEPKQAVFFSINKLKLLDVAINTYSKESEETAKSKGEYNRSLLENAPSKGDLVRYRISYIEMNRKEELYLYKSDLEYFQKKGDNYELKNYERNHLERMKKLKENEKKLFRVTSVEWEEYVRKPDSYHFVDLKSHDEYVSLTLRDFLQQFEFVEKKKKTRAPKVSS